MKIKNITIEIYLGPDAFKNMFVQVVVQVKYTIYVALKFFPKYLNLRAPQNFVI